MSTFVQLATLSDLPEQGGRLAVVDESWIGLFRTSEAVYAVEGKCPHAQANLARGDVCEGVVYCPVHLWRFRLADGAYLDAEAPQFNLRTYRVKLEEDAVWVELPSVPTTIRLI